VIKNYITPGGFKRLQDEYHHLKAIVRPEVTRLVSWAASLGDRSENADYQYGKKRLREIDRRLRFLGKRIAEAEVVDPEAIENDCIQFGATVTVCDDEQKRIYTIVGVDETDAKIGFISWRSPIGKALIGKSMDDEVFVQTPSGEVSFEVVSIDYKKVPIKEYIYEGSSQHQSR
jgi:transcription elongation factor GreB